MKRRRRKKPYTLLEAQARLSDMLDRIDFLANEREDLDLTEACRALHAFSQGVSVLKGLVEAEAAAEVPELRERLRALEDHARRLNA